MKNISIEFDSAFVEEAVFFVMEREDEEGDRILAKRFYDERDWTYEERGDPEIHEERFRSFYRRWFKQLGLEAFFEKLLAEFPLILRARLPLFVKRAWERKQEGAELYRQGDRKILVIRLQVNRVNDLEWLTAFLREELFHISDMLDPRFEYSPDVFLGGENEAENDLIRDRFRLLWNLSIQGRMRKKGWKSVIPLEMRHREFDEAFLLWDPEKKRKIFQELGRGSPWSQRKLLELAGMKGLKQSLFEEIRV